MGKYSASAEQYNLTIGPSLVNILTAKLTIEAKAVTVVAQCMNDADGSAGITNSLLDEVQAGITLLPAEQFRLRLDSQHCNKIRIVIRLTSSE